MYLFIYLLLTEFWEEKKCRECLNLFPVVFKLLWPNVLFYNIHEEISPFNPLHEVCIDPKSRH